MPGAGSARTERVEGVLRPVAQAAGLVLEDVTITPAGKRRLVRVLVDRDVPDGEDDLTSTIEPLSLDEVAEVNRAIGEVLDDTDAMGEAPYVLEVSSPGTDRPLIERRHFRRNVGRLVAVTTSNGVQRTGRIRSAGSASFELETDDEHPHTISYDECTRARIELEFSHPSGSDDRTDAPMKEDR